MSVLNTFDLASMTPRMTFYLNSTYESPNLPKRCI